MGARTTAQKLALKPGQTLLLVNAPPTYRGSLGSLPDGARLASGPAGGADVIQAFVGSRKELETSLSEWKKKLNPGGSIWVSYRKGGSKAKADINRDSIRQYATSVGLEAVAIFAVDDSWSALRLKLSKGA